MSQIYKPLTSSGPIPPTIATSYVTDSGTAVPSANILNVKGGTSLAGTTPLHTVGTGNTVTIDAQISQAIAASNATNIGMSAFNSAEFTVDSNGFVSLVGNAASIEKINLQTGTSPIVPLSGAITFNGATVLAGSNPVRTDGTGANTMALQVQISQAIAASNATNIGLAAFNSAQFTVDANGFVSITNDSPFNYIQINHASSPYTATATDEYISADPSSGVITILLPNAPTLYRRFTIKDRTGSAASNNISVTTVGGVVTIDGATTYTLATNYSAIQLLFNGTSYEVY